ncbi:hypothetical protein AX17_003516 [Amanita inopinata Kibby_2008]|nr:hypothetical protein AX17_003516 [Amanita inopinata Kibby_2008]
MNASTQIPRTLVPQSSYATIDSILKDLKICSRRIQQALAAHADELQVLHRIYYKSKNQHRGALFWRRVVEIRRYSERLNGINVIPTLEQLRVEFFAPDASRNPKLLKSSWTHVPPRIAVCDALISFRATCTLLQKMEERLVEAYRSFLSAMQNGAFVQLFLVLIAMTARIRMLSVEVQEALSLVSSSLERFLKNVNDNVMTVDAATQISPADNGAVSDEVNVATTLKDAACTKHQAIPRVIVHRPPTKPKEPKKTASVRHLESTDVRKAKRARRVKDEIDDIFSVTHSV